MEVAVPTEEVRCVRVFLYRRRDFNDVRTKHGKLETILREHETRRVSIKCLMLFRNAGVDFLQLISVLFLFSISGSTDA